jgi:hypothetical protein
MSQNKRVNIILVKDIEDTTTDADGKPIVIKAGERVMRTTRSFAEKLIKDSNGAWAYTSKSKLKCFLNRDMKLYRNMKTIEKMQDITGETFNERRSNGSTIVLVPDMKFKRAPAVYTEREVYKAVEQRERVKADGTLGRYRKSDKSRFTRITIKKTLRFNPTAKAIKTHRINNTKKAQVFESGTKVLVVAF